MGLIDCCEQDFGTKSLYDVLGVEKTATRKELKYAYKSPAFFLLPSQAIPHRLDEFVRKFEIVSKVYYILSDAKKRKVYDETGVIDNSIDKTNTLFWIGFWRKVFPHIVPEDVADFKARYKNSEEEKEYLRIAYLRAKGNMDRFAEIYFAYTAEDEERISDIMRTELIDKKKMRAYAKFTREEPASIEARKNKYKRPNPDSSESSKTKRLCLEESAAKRKKAKQDDKAPQQA